MSALLTQPGFDSIFESLFTYTAFRFQGRGHYPQALEDKQRFPHWQRTGELVPDEPWLSLIRRVTASGRQMRRITLVQQPPSQWGLYAVASHRMSTAAGEHIRYLPYSDADEAPSWDYWLFDAKVVFKLLHSDTEPLMVERAADPRVVAEANAWRESAWHRGTPFEQYVQEIGA